MISTTATHPVHSAEHYGQVQVAAPIHTTIVIPVYNEEEALPHVLDAIFAVVDAGFEVLVVDDGSSDGTRAAAMAYPCRLVVHEANRGKGGAMKTGFAHARGENVIVIDGDATYPADAIPEMVRQLERHDLVRCVRSAGLDNMPLVNRLGNLIFDQIIRHVHQVQGSDMLSGLYGARRRHLLAMRLEAEGFDIESEILIKAQAMGLTAHSMPISYGERIGAKKLDPLRDGTTILWRILALALKYNPFLMYVIPGMALLLLSLATLALLVHGPIFTPFAGLSTHTLILSAMSFLAGFQLIVLGCVVNLYAAESGLGEPNRALSLVAARFPRLQGAVAGVAMSGVGLAWTALLAVGWLGAGAGAFEETEQLVIALSCVVWGVQIVSAMLFLSLFAGLARYRIANLKLKG